MLFVCVRNAGRSQMAEALFARAAAGRAIARSAGSVPAEAPHPEVVESMREIGIDVSGAGPKGLTPEILDGVDVVVTMGCGDACPHVPGARTIDWDLPDPAGLSPDEVAAIRDEIARRTAALAAEITGRLAQ